MASPSPPVLIEELTEQSLPETIRHARELLLEYGNFVASQPNVASFCFGALQEEATDLPGSYLSQAGGSLLATRGSRAIGFVAWRTLPNLPDAWELKRLWTRSEARGLGIGTALVQAVIERARVHEKTSIFLDTAPEAMASAHQLYLRLGFVPCPAYAGKALPGIAYMRMFLTGQ